MEQNRLIVSELLDPKHGQFAKSENMEIRGQIFLVTKTKFVF